MGAKIQQHKEKISRYQKVMEILPKTAEDKLQSTSPNKSKVNVSEVLNWEWDQAVIADGWMYAMLQKCW